MQPHLTMYINPMTILLISTCSHCFFPWAGPKHSSIVGRTKGKIYAINAFSFVERFSICQPYIPKQQKQVYYCTAKTVNVKLLSKFIFLFIFFLGILFLQSRVFFPFTVSWLLLNPCEVKPETDSIKFQPRQICIFKNRRVFG